MKQILTLSYVMLSALFLTLLLLGCDQREDVKKISLAETVSRELIQQEKSGSENLRVAVAAILSPQASYAIYREMLTFFEKKMNVAVTMVQRETYKEINDLIGENKLDMAFVCTGAYVAEGKNRNMELLVAPVVNGEPFYYSYIISSKQSGIQSVEDLLGKSFAFTDPLSNTGYLSPQFLMLERGLKSGKFFYKTLFTHSHDRSIETVAKGLVDGAAVDSLVYDHLKKTKPDLLKNVKVIEKSPPYGIPPVVVTQDMDSKKKEQLRNIFLTMHENQQGRTVLDRLGIEKFVVVDDSLYDSVREMYGRLRFVKKND